MDRSNIDLLGNATSGINLGTGESVFKCKDITGNTLQFKTICATGGLSIITGDTELTIVGTTGITISGASNYVLKINNTGNNVEASSILDSGTTNIHICKDTIYLGTGTGSSTCITIKPSSPRKIELLASSGVNIGALNACLCISCTPDGLTLCSAAYQDLLVHAGCCSASGCAGKTLKLSGGDGATGGMGGNVLLTGGTGCVGGNIILSTSNSGKVQITGLPVKTIQTCVVYISGGTLSYGTIPTGMTTIAGGTVNRVPVFNAAGNNIQNSTLTMSSDVLSNCSSLTIEAPDTNYIYLNAPNSLPGVCYGSVLLGKPTTSSVITAQRLCTTGAATNIDMFLLPKGGGQIYALASTVNLSNSGSFGFGFTSASRTFQLPTNAKICGYHGSASNCDGTPICLIGSFGANYTGWAGSGGTILICGGCACSAAGVGVPKVGGSVVLKAGPGICGGADGRIQLCGLPAKGSETCGIYIDSVGRLSTGVISGGSGGGGLTVAITGATNGVCAFTNKCVCLGGSIVGLSKLCASGIGNGLALCSVCGACSGVTSICCGGFSTCSLNCSTSPGWSSCISNAGSMTLTSYNGVCGNTILIRPDAIYITQSGGAGNTGLQYSVCDYSRFNSNSRAIPDAGWVKSCILGWSNLINGQISAGCQTPVSGSLGSCNTVYGVCAGASMATGFNNTAIGFQTLTAAGNTGCNNTAVGQQAIQLNTTGTHNTAVGGCALACNTTGCGNTALGFMAMWCNCSGWHNIGIGYGTFQSNKTGSCNVAIGYRAMQASDTGCDNVVIGRQAMTLNNTGCFNIALGSEALCYNTSGNYNIGIGYKTNRNNLTGTDNIAIGTCALLNNTCCELIAIGLEALTSNTSGSRNIAVGARTLNRNTTGYDNIAIGNNALYYNTTGIDNTAIGNSTLCSNTTGTHNIAIGYQALKANTIGQQNVALGMGSLQANTTGFDNVGIGFFSLYYNTSGCDNIGLGNAVFQNNTVGCHNVGIGGTALAYTTTGCYNTAVGSTALANNCAQSYNTGVGYGALHYNSGGTGNVAVGYQAHLGSTIAGTAKTGYNNVALGYQALKEITTGYNNVAIGYQALYSNTGGTCNTAIGMQALYNNKSGNDNIAIGKGTLRTNTTGTGNIGQGYEALRYNTIGSNNIAQGCWALQCNTIGQNNFAEGYQAMRYNVSGNSNIVLGVNGLLNNTKGCNNIAMGETTMCGNVSGGDNIGIGRRALFSNMYGCCNIAIGCGAGYLTTGSSNIFIGNCAGCIETGSNKLHIANSHLCTLIYGEFDTKCVKICGKLEASGSITPASSADGGMPNNSIYYSTTSGKLVYKDSGGVVHDLY